MTTLNPRQPYTDDELRELYPDSLKLEQVQVLLRHGERTPVSPRFQNAGLIPHWPLCSAARHLRTVVMNSDGNFEELIYRRRLEIFTSDNDDSARVLNPSTSPTAETCNAGELTDIGRRTTLALGTRLRHLYVDQLQFLPTMLSRSLQSELYLRTTPIPRALESVQQAFFGLYPKKSQGPDVSEAAFIVRPVPDETLYPNENMCKRLRELATAFGNRTADRYNDSPELAYVNSKIGKWMSKEHPKVKVDGHPRLSGVYDTINSSLAHGKLTRLPSEFYDPKVISSIDKVEVEEWFSGYQENAEYRRLGVGALAADITVRLVDRARLLHGTDAADDAPPGGIRFGLTGCHDTTLAALLSSLGAFKGESWPPYTSHIALELFRERDQGFVSSLWARIVGKTPSPAGLTKATPPRTPLRLWSANDRSALDGFFVRVRYNDRVMRVPGCAADGRHREGDTSMCTLAAFKEVVDGFTPKNWKKECGSNLGSSAFPEKIEEAGY